MRDQLIMGMVHSKAFKKIEATVKEFGFSRDILQYSSCDYSGLMCGLTCPNIRPDWEIKEILAGRFAVQNVMVIRKAIMKHTSLFSDCYSRYATSEFSRRLANGKIIKFPGLVVFFEMKKFKKELALHTKKFNECDRRVKKITRDANSLVRSLLLMNATESEVNFAVERL